MLESEVSIRYPTGELTPFFRLNNIALTPKTLARTLALPLRMLPTLRTHPSLRRAGGRSPYSIPSCSHPVKRMKGLYREGKMHPSG